MGFVKRAALLGVAVGGVGAVLAWRHMQRNGLTVSDLLSGTQRAGVAVVRSSTEDLSGSGRPDHRRDDAPVPPSGSAGSARVNAAVSVLSHSARLDAEAVSNDVGCGSDVAVLHSLALHVAAIKAADALVLEGVSDAPRRTLTSLVAGGCRVGVATSPTASGSRRASAPTGTSVADAELDGVRAPFLLRMTAPADVAALLIKDGRGLETVSPAARLVARAIAAILYDGSTGGAPLALADQDAVTAELVACLLAVLKAAASRACDGSGGPHRDLLAAVDDVAALLLVPFVELERRLQPAAPVPAHDPANAVAFADILRTAMEANPREGAAEGSPRVAPAALARSSLQRGMVQWVERLRSAVLQALLGLDWVAAHLSARPSEPGSVALLHVAASAVGSPYSAASRDEPLRRLSALLATASEPFAVLSANGERAVPPPTATQLTAKVQSPEYAGDNVLHALLRPLTVRAVALANTAKQPQAVPTRAELSRAAAAFDAVGQHVLLAVGFILGRCHETPAEVAPGDHHHSHHQQQHGGQNHNGATAAMPAEEGSIVMVGAEAMAAATAAPATTQRWLQLGDGPEGRRRVAVSTISADGLTPYLLADKAARTLKACEALPPSMATRMDAICGALATSEFDIV